MVSERRLERLEAVLSQRLVGLTLLLEDVHDPQNMSACLRTAEAMGLQDVHVVELGVHFKPNPRITQGCDKWLDVSRHTDVDAAVATLRQTGHRVLVTALDATDTLDTLDFAQPTCLAFGNEKAGVTHRLRELADGTFKIPMMGFVQSFNLSVAVGICAYAAATARRHALGCASDLPAERRATLHERWVRLACEHSEAVLAELSRRDADT